MKKILFAVVMLAFFSFIPKRFQPDPNKKYGVLMEHTVAEWQAILSTLSQSPTLSAKAANEISSEIINQLNPQIAKDNDTTKPKTPVKIK